ncbi:MAG: hypothetical protein WD576_05175 [Nitriliruptoraceae bacterium]
MADRYTSQIALVLDRAVDDVAELVRAAGASKDLDRAAAVRDEGMRAQEVHWGGRMQKAIVRALVDDDQPLLRTETYVGADGLEHGLQRQAQLLQGLSRHLRGNIIGVRDLSAQTDRDEAWMNRVAVGVVDYDDAIVVRHEGVGTWWVRTHGAARFDVPDLELYGLNRGQVDAAVAMLRVIHEQLLRTGLKTPLRLADDTPVYLVPVLEAWQQLPFEWPGVGRAGQDRGDGLDGPRATLSVLHRPRFGRYRRDLAGVIERVPAHEPR